MLLGRPGDEPEAYAGADTPGTGEGRMTRVEGRHAGGAVVGLAHRRLSILDLSPLGHQPMRSADGRYWMVYNGEVYNYVQLRGLLERLGHCFISGSDTEVVLAAFSQWGEAALERMRGMWALAIYDRLSHRLFLARDRFGIKPLYYWIAPDGVLCFASEIKAFTAWTGWAPEVNAQRAYDFLAFGVSDHTDETMFAGVYQLKPGSCIQLDIDSVARQADGRVPARSWYNLRARSFDGDFESATRLFRERFFDSVALHMQADVPIGSCLSGGLDSSSIVCTMQSLLATQGKAGLQKTFSACSTDARIDERTWIDMVVRAKGIDAHYLYPGLGELFERVGSMTWYQDEPFGSTSIFAQWCVFEAAARANVKVMLDGQGADEALGGYHNFFGARLGSLLRRFRWPELAQEVGALRQMHGYSSLRVAQSLANVVLPERMRQLLRSRTGHSTVRPEWLDLRRLEAAPLDPFTACGYDRSSVEALSMAQLTATSLQMMLHWEDRNSMAHSVEARVPFLDHELVELVLGMPDEFKVWRGITKRVQRGAMEGVLPEPVRNRIDKIGFQTAEEMWMRREGRRLFRAHLEEAVAASGGILTGACLSIFDDVARGGTPYSSLIWRWISFGEWMKAFFSESRPVVPATVPRFAESCQHAA